MFGVIEQREPQMTKPRSKPSTAVDKSRKPSTSKKEPAQENMLAIGARYHAICNVR
jgi:hypothetical protein